MSLAVGPASYVYEAIHKIYAGELEQNILQSYGGQLHFGGYTDGEAQLGFGKFGNKNIKVGGEFEGNVGGFVGIENNYAFGRPTESAVKAGLEASLSGNVGVMGGYLKFNQSKLRGLGLDLAGASEVHLEGKVWQANNAASPSRVEVVMDRELSGGIIVDVLGWKDLQATGSADSILELCETLTYTLPSAESYTRLKAFGAIWDILGSRVAQNVTLKGSYADGLLRGILEGPEENGQTIDYERSVHRATSWGAPFPVDLDVIAAGLKFELGVKLERGAEAVTERGKIWHSLRMPLEWYPDNTANLIPTQNILSKEAEWIRQATPELEGFYRRVGYVVEGVYDYGIEVKEGWRNARLNISYGIELGKGTIYSIFAGKQPAGTSGGTPLRSSYFYSVANTPAYLPPSGSSNYMYGISGLFKFEGTNSFGGIGTLTIGYTNSDVIGLNEADLRIYRLADNTNRWTLVGGTVDAVSNTVTATIKDFGTYAIAPPLPSGDLSLNPSTNSLLADGVSQMTVTVTNLLLNTGANATQSWLFTASAAGVELLNIDVDTNTPGVQVISSNATVRLLLRAPLGGSYGSVSLASVAGDAFGTLGISVTDDAAPAAPVAITLSAGQSRILVSWRTNSEPDIAGYRVYYRKGASGPPYDGVAAIEGASSPVEVGGTNFVLRGLNLGTNYFVAVSAVDTTGNESPLALAGQATTTQGPPAPPMSVAARFKEGTNVIMWALSEDDGYNDRDVMRYDVWRAVLPGGSFVKIGEAPGGVGLYSEALAGVSANQYVRYAVTAVDSNGLSSAQMLANRVLPNGRGIDNDGDGMADDWELSHGLSPQNPMDRFDDPDHDGLTNLEEYQRGKDPTVFDNLRFGSAVLGTNGLFQFAVYGEVGRNYLIEASTNLVVWSTLTNMACTGSTMLFTDWTSPSFSRRFYRVAVYASAAQIQLHLESPNLVISGGMGLSLTGEPGVNYRVDVSTDLTTWTPLTNFISTEATMHFFDSSATNFNQRFYRAVAP